jgi:hypothetical protein
MPTRKEMKKAAVAVVVIGALAALVCMIPQKKAFGPDAAPTVEAASTAVAPAAVAPPVPEIKKILPPCVSQFSHRENKVLDGLELESQMTIGAIRFRSGKPACRMQAKLLDILATMPEDQRDSGVTVAVSQLERK